MKKLVFERDAYLGEEILLIGPGRSSEMIDLSDAIRNIKYTCTINDTYLNMYSDFWFSGVGFYLLQKFFEQDFKFFQSKRVLKVFSSHNKPVFQKTFIHRAQALQMIEELNLPNSHVITRLESDYPENDTALHTDNLQENMANTDLDRYILTPFTGSTSSVLQTLFKLGFAKVYFIGFLDSNTLEHRHTGMKQWLPVKSLQPEQRLQIRFAYLEAIKRVYQKNNREIVNLCPPEVSIFSGFEFSDMFKKG